MTDIANPTEPVAAKPKPARVESIDAFRGFTIFSMIFVIMAAGYRNLPLTFPHFGSAPVSTFKHASEDGEAREWAFWEGVTTSTVYRSAVVRERNGDRYSVAVLDDEGTTQSILRGYKVVHPRPLRAGEKVIAVYGDGPESQQPRFIGEGNGCTFCDLVAPFFVFIVGLCLPLSRQRRGGAWWRHVGTRTLLLILAGVIYISLILKLSYWWGILQAIGVAYFMGAASMFLPVWGRWVAIVSIAAFHGFMIQRFPWWTSIGDSARPFLTIANLHGDPLRPLTVHCTPWASISWGIITMIGVLVGEAVATRNRLKIVEQCALTGFVFAVGGLLIHNGLQPMNKDMVTPAYSFFTAGMGSVCFLAFYWVIDVWGVKDWAYVFRVFGANALLAYFMQPFVRVFFVALGLYAFFGNHGGWDGMMWALIWTMVLWCVVLWCNRKGIYWKL